MQILGIYLDFASAEIRKSLHNNTWYGFQYENEIRNIFHNEYNCREFLKELSNKQAFAKSFYDYSGNQIYINAIIGKNGSGKSSLLNIYHIIINNFAAKIKERFPEYNRDYEIEPVLGLTASLFYECNNLIYCIKIEDSKVDFSNNKTKDLLSSIQTLEELSNHIFYTVSTNYSLYSENPDWLVNLYHKNDGYFTPIVLVPFRDNGNIDIVKENRLAEKRVQILSLLLYKDKQRDFIENYIPYKIDYKLKNFEEYKKNLDDKIKKLNQNFKFTKIYNKTNIGALKTEIKNYWSNYFSKGKDSSIAFSNHIKEYAIYKTLKSCLNYESISKQVNFDNLKNSIKKIIENELWNEHHVNYINLKLLTCKKYLEYSSLNIYKSNEGSIKIDDLLNNQEIKNAASFDQLYILSLPDFFETQFYYSIKPNEKENSKKIISVDELELMQLTQMSSGEQQLYDILSYVVYHIKNAQSNKSSVGKGRIPYKNFNIMFDEAELYYHPEYQRCFIRNLIKLINRSNLGINGLSITLVTHSPFILSDIKSEDILALEEGKPSKKVSKTLGANIYDLLQN